MRGRVVAVEGRPVTAAVLWLWVAAFDLAAWLGIVEVARGVL